MQQVEQFVNTAVCSIKNADLNLTTANANLANTNAACSCPATHAKKTTWFAATTTNAPTIAPSATAYIENPGVATVTRALYHCGPVGGPSASAGAGAGPSASAGASAIVWSTTEPTCPAGKTLALGAGGGNQGKYACV